MFGTKLRTWMETHIVRSRKKQNRNKEDKKTGNYSKSSPCHIESNSFERQHGKTSPRCHGSEGIVEVQATAVGLPSTTSMSLLKNSTFRSAVNNLSSPESAYSTGYSTDGTSPGASIPPEYYINIRTGTHYFHSKPINSSNSSALPAPQDLKVGNTSSKVLSGGTAYKVGSLSQPPVSITVLSPRPGRHKREDGTKKKTRQNDEQLPESSTEEDIADRLGKVSHSSTQPMLTPKAKVKLIHPIFHNLHRRTESYDESQQRSSGHTHQKDSGQSHQRDSGDSLTTSTSNGYHCTSPYLPGASPRQRNRIRTNPWLNTNHVVSGPVPGLPGSKSYNSQGETSSTVGSSSTLSSSGCKPNSDENTQECMSARSRERRRLMKDHSSQDMKNCSSFQNETKFFSPISNIKKHINALTTSSLKQNRSCQRSLRPKSPASSTSGSSSPSPASEDEHHGNTSDFSDDDVTLNEMLGKFDESYVYEKETDILSDSDPTDCEEQTAEEERTENNNFLESDRQEDFDFIDNGSMVELAHSDSENFNKTQLAGHCTYHHLSRNTPEKMRKMSPRRRESLMRRKSGNSSQDRLFHNCSGKRGSEGLRNVDSPFLILSNKRFSTYKKSSTQSLQLQSSSEVISHCSTSAQQQKRSTIVDSNTQQPGDYPGKYMNLNRVLMERLITNQRNGTRSADGTPVTLRKRSSPSIYNGKYIKNHYVTNLISSNANFNNRKNSTEESLEYSDLNAKPRSHSISGHSSQIVNMPRTPCPVGIGLNDLDKEGDMKYRKLIEEAENIIEDLQVKTKSDLLSPTFRCKNGMERAKPSSPLVFSVPPSPLSLRYDICRDGYETLPGEHCSNNNSLYDQSTYPPQKDKICESEDSLLKTISKTLEKIIIRGTSDTNRKLDKSVSDPFAKGKRTFVLPSTEVIYSNINPKCCGQQNRSRTGLVTQNLLRRSSTGNSSSKLMHFNSATKLNQNDLSSQSSFRKIFRRPDKSKTTSVNEHLDKHNYPENGFCLNSSLTNFPKEHTYENIMNQDTNNSNHECMNAKLIEKRGLLVDYSPNGNTPTYVNGFQQIPWQHRTSQAERLKHLSDFQQQSPTSKTDSTELLFEETPSLVGFKSFDLGNTNVVGTGYCPQSEPVKRKVYTCSATFEKLQKTLLGKQTDVHPSNKKKIEIESGDLLVSRGHLVPVIKENIREESKESEIHEHVNRTVLVTDKVETG